MKKKTTDNVSVAQQKYQPVIAGYDPQPQ